MIISLVQDISQLGTESGAAAGGLTVAGVTSAIWLLAKYGTAEELGDFLQSSSNVWTRSSWVARQAAAVMPILNATAQNQVRARIIRSGLVEALRVIASLEQLENFTSLDPQLRSYLLHPQSQGHPYPLEKAIIAHVILYGRLGRPEKADLRSRLLGLVTDPCYLSIIRRRAH